MIIYAVLNGQWFNMYLKKKLNKTEHFIRGTDYSLCNRLPSVRPSNRLTGWDLYMINLLKRDKLIRKILGECARVIFVIRFILPF